MKTHLLIWLTLGLSLPSIAQQSPMAVRANVFLPYIIHFGGEVGTVHHLKSWDSEKRIHQFWLSPQLGFSAFIGVQENYSLHTDVEYRLRRDDKKVFPLATVGLGYMLSVQRVDGAVDLGSGEITHTRRPLHFLTPAIGLGLGRQLSPTLTYTASVFFGRRLGLNTLNEGYFGLRAGLIMNLTSSTT